MACKKAQRNEYAYGKENGLRTWHGSVLRYEKELGTESVKLGVIYQGGNKFAGAAIDKEEESETRTKREELRL